MEKSGILLLLSLLVISGCTQTETTTTQVESDGSTTVTRETERDVPTAGEVQKEAKEAFDATAAYLGNEKDRLTATIKQRLPELEKKIGELESRLKTEQGTKKAGTEKELSDARAEKSALERTLQDLPRATGAAWEKIKAEFKAGQESARQ